MSSVRQRASLSTTQSRNSHLFIMPFSRDRLGTNDLSTPNGEPRSPARKQLWRRPRTVSFRRRLARWYARSEQQLHTRHAFVALVGPRNTAPGACRIS